MEVVEAVEKPLMVLLMLLELVVLVAVQMETRLAQGLRVLQTLVAVEVVLQRLKQAVLEALALSSSAFQAHLLMRQA
jgi:hypothetical protein